MNDIVKPDWVLRDSQANRAGLTRCAPSPCFGRINCAAFARVDRLAVLGCGPLTLKLKLLFGAEAQICLVLLYEPLGVLAINCQSVRLPIWAELTAHIRPFVPIEAKPLQIANELIFEAGFAAVHVGVLDAENHRSALLSRKE